jgi:transposase
MIFFVGAGCGPWGDFGMTNLVTITCSECGHTAEVELPGGSGSRSFRCSVCNGKGAIQPRDLSGVVAAEYVCAGCAVELSPTTLRQIGGQLYCVKCANNAESGKKRFVEKAWNDFKGPTSWGKH